MTARRLTHRRRPAMGATLFALGLIGLSGGCIFPTDASDELHVEIIGGVSQLFIGDSLTVRARVVDGAGKTVGNVSFKYESTDQSVVFVDSRGRMLGIGDGVAEIRAEALQLSSALPAALPVRVFEGIEISEYLPSVTESPDNKTVRYGEPLTLVGKGLNPAELALLQMGPFVPRVERFVPADLSSTETRDSLTIIVPGRLPESVEFVIAAANKGNIITPFTVMPEDIWEVAEDDPANIGDLADGDREIRDLVIEAGEAFPWELDLIQTDWYRGTIGPSGEVSVVIRFPEPEISPLGAFEIYDWPILADIGPAWPDLFFDPPYSSVRPLHLNLGSGGICGQAMFVTFFENWDRDSILVSLKDLPDGFSPEQFDIAMWKVFPTEDALPYEIRVVADYLSTLPPDVAEENDLCDLAYPLTTDGQSLSLTLDHSQDLDWFEFTSTANPLVSAPATNIVPETGNNTTCETADTVVLGDRATGYPDPDQTDCYAVFLEAGTLLDLDVDAEINGSSLDAVLFLYDSDGNFLARSDFEETPTSFTLDARIRFPVTTTGWYWVEIAEAGLVCGCNPGIGGPLFFYELAFTEFISGTLLQAEMTSDTFFEGRFDFFVAPDGPFGIPQPGYVFNFWSVFWKFVAEETETGAWTMRFIDYVPTGDYLLLVTDPPGASINYDLTLTEIEIGVTPVGEYPVAVPLARPTLDQEAAFYELKRTQRDLVAQRSAPGGNVSRYR